MAKKPHIYDAASVRGLIDKTLEANAELGHGNNARVYAFEDDAFRNYVLRVGALKHGMTLDDALTSKTKLTPPTLMVRGANMGQALLVNNARHHDPFLGIHLRVAGMSLHDIRDKMQDARARLDFMLQRIDATSINPFVGLFEDVYRVAISGYKPDTNLKNILYDYTHGTMRVIDQVSFPAPPMGHADAMEHVQGLARKMMSAFAPLLPEGVSRDVADAYGLQKDRLKALVEDAVHGIDAAIAAGNGPAKLAFGVVKDVKAAKMDTPRAQLLQTLDALSLQAIHR